MIDFISSHSWGCLNLVHLSQEHMCNLTKGASDLWISRNTII